MTSNIPVAETVDELISTRDALCIISTTSTFAPRVPDDVVGIAKLCESRNIPHLINNAYGLQCSKCCHEIEHASRAGRVDFVVQSCDKNFLVPVGGAIVSSPNAKNIKALGKAYAGRASINPTLDLLITILQMGRTGYQHLLKERMDNFTYLQCKLREVAARIGGHVRLLDSRRNGISLALQLREYSETPNNKSLTCIGSELYSRRCSGVRVIECNGSLTSLSDKFSFQNFGSHCNTPTTACYLTAACAIGSTRQEIDTFVAKLENVLRREII